MFAISRHLRQHPGAVMQSSLRSLTIPLLTPTSASPSPNHMSYVPLRRSPILSPNRYMSSSTSSLSSSVVIDTIQQGLIEFQALSSLPWYASIAASTVLIRLALLPITREQMISSNKFAKALPEISLLNELMKQSLSKTSLNTVSQKKEAVSNYITGFKAALKIHNVSFAPMVILPLMNLSIFITFIYAVRGLILYKDFECGGTLWFEDLQDHDSTLILPAIAMCGTYLSLDLSFRSVEEGTFFAKVKDLLQTSVLIALPVTSLLPAGIFCYWIPSTMAITSQMLLLRQPAVLKLLNIPVPQKQSGFRMPEVKEE